LSARLLDQFDISEAEIRRIVSGAIDGADDGELFAVGFAWYVTHLVCLFTLLGVPFAALGARFEGRIDAAIERTRPALLSTLAIGAGLAVAFSERLHAYTGAEQARQFPERVDLLRGFAHFGGVLVLVVLCVGILLRAFGWLFERAPNLARPRVAVALSGLLLVLAGVLAADFALFSIHLDEFAPVITLGAVGLSAIVGVCMWRSPGRRWGKASLALAIGLLLVEPFGPLRDPHALFLIHNHSPLTGAVMM
jgi:hypothetical protein